MGINSPDTGFFVTTGRPLDYLSEIAGVTTVEFLKPFPEKGTIFISGSDLDQKFEKEILSVRGDLKLVSMDPTLRTDAQTGMLPAQTKIVVVKSHTTGRVLGYDYTNEPLPAIHERYKKMDNMDRGEEPTMDHILLSNEEAARVHESRLKQLGNNGMAVAAITPLLPFKSNSFDGFFDVYGPLFCDSVKASQYLMELHRILKTNRIGYVFGSNTIIAKVNNPTIFERQILGKQSEAVLLQKK